MRFSSLDPPNEDPGDGGEAAPAFPTGTNHARSPAARERSYRLCRLDPNGKVGATEVLRAPHDRAALALMRKLTSSHGLELRHGPRWVGCAPARPARSDKDA